MKINFLRSAKWGQGVFMQSVSRYDLCLLSQWRVVQDGGRGTKEWFVWRLRWEPLELCHRNRGESLSCHTSQYSWSHNLNIQVTFNYLLSMDCKISWSDYQRGRCPWLVMWWVGLSDPIECDPMSLSANGSDLCPWIMTRVLSTLCLGSKYLIRWSDLRGSLSIFAFTIYNQWVSS